MPHIRRVGADGISSTHLPAYRELTNRIELVAVVDSHSPTTYAGG